MNPQIRCTCADLAGWCTDRLHEAGADSSIPLAGLADVGTAAFGSQLATALLAGVTAGLTLAPYLRKAAAMKVGRRV